MSFILASTLVLLIGAALCFALRGNHTQAWAAIVSQAIASVLILVPTLPVLFGGPELKGELFWTFPVDRIGLRVDALGAFFLAFSLPMTLLGTIYALGYLAPLFGNRRHVGVHFAILNMVSVSYILVYTVENALVFLLGWEVAALSAWLAVIRDYKNQKIRFAGFNYLVSTHLSLLFLIAGFMIMGSATGSFDFQEFRHFLGTNSSLRNAAFLLLLTSFGLKSAYFPFHTWLPRAHSAAPAHVSALMSGVIHKAGIFGILKFTLLMGTPERWMGWCILGFSTLSAFMGVLYTATQRDLKRLLGYSSTENVGIAGIGIGVGYLGLYWHKPVLVALGFSGALLHVVNHALFKCLLFYAAGAVYRMTHTIDLEKLGGLIKKMPQTSFFFLIGALAISALPPFNGFVSEFLIYNGLFSSEIPDSSSRAILVAEAAALAIIGAISALSMTRAFGVTFLGSPRDSSIECHEEAPRSMRFSMALHTMGLIIMGLIPISGVRWVTEPTRLFFQAGAGSVEMEPALRHLEEVMLPILRMGGIFVVVLICVFALRRILLPKSDRRHVTWACGYTSPNSRMQYTGSSFSAQFLSLTLDESPQRGATLCVRRGSLVSDAYRTPGGRAMSAQTITTMHFVFHLLVLLIAPIFVIGLINRTKAIWAGRKGPQLNQFFFDLRRLLRKAPVYSDVSSWIFQIAPWVVLTTSFVAALLSPIIPGFSPIAFSCDFVYFAYLLGLGRAFMILGALDTGSSFEGMGASREAAYSALIEPALFFAIGTLGIATGVNSFHELVHFVQAGQISWPVRFGLFL
ncbi:MAG: NADH-quinone oxidoreductase subunit H, partial [Deltaproteobacteria bacterium]|nr:NADH-quinone oxidoreductase subunit H [Deltaproteobacteria bacterium]